MNTFYITEEQWATLVAGGSITIEGVEYTYDSKNMYCVKTECVKTESTPTTILYQHNITLTTDTLNQVRARCSIINNSNTPFTYTLLREYLYSNGLTVTDRNTKVLLATGGHFDFPKGKSIVGLVASTSQINVVYQDNTVQACETGAVFEDTIIQIL